MVEDIALVVGRNVHRQHVRLAVFDDDIAVFQVERAGADGLDLRALELDARLVAVFDKIVVERLAVLRRDLYPLFLRHGTSPPLRFHDSVAYFFAQHKGCHKNVTIRKNAAFRSILPIHFNL